MLKKKNRSTINYIFFLFIPMFFFFFYSCFQLFLVPFPFFSFSFPSPKLLWFHVIFLFMKKIIRWFFSPFLLCFTSFLYLYLLLSTVLHVLHLFLFLWSLFHKHFPTFSPYNSSFNVLQKEYLHLFSFTIPTVQVFIFTNLFFYFFFIVKVFIIYKKEHLKPFSFTLSTVQVFKFTNVFFFYTSFFFTVKSFHNMQKENIYKPIFHTQ